MKQLKSLSDTENQIITLSKVGSGTLYYRLNLKYSKSLNTPVTFLYNGFQIERVYNSMPKENNVECTLEGDMKLYKVKTGSRVKVTINIYVPSAIRYYVALIDPLPAGFEVLNENLKGSENHKECPWYWWFTHKNIRDHQVELYAVSLTQGTYTYSYFARATTPGQYISQPCKIEEMYSPEVFGRWNSEIVHIE